MARHTHKSGKRRVVPSVTTCAVLFAGAIAFSVVARFPFQLAHNVGHAMEPAIKDQQRVIVNKLAYRIGEPHHGDIVMLYYPIDPNKSFVKRVIAEEGDTVRIVDGHVFVNEAPLDDSYVPEDFRDHDDWGPQVVQGRVLLRDGRPPEQQLGQPALGLGAQEVHHWESRRHITVSASERASRSSS